MNFNKLNNSIHIYNQFYVLYYVRLHVQLYMGFVPKINLFVFVFLHRESLAFATEPVFASLANILGHHHNLPAPVPPQIEKHKLYDVEIKYGLLQVSLVV